MHDAATRTCDTAPGPDGIPYALWRGDPSLADALWCMMEQVGGGVGGGRPRAFGASVSNMIPKVDILFEGDTAAVRVASAHPLACGNTDCNILALTANRPINSACAATPSEHQRGFIVGRSMADSVLLCETTMGGVSLIGRRAAVVFLDFATAFLSLKHCWLFAVLRRAGIPEFVINIVKFLYTEQETLFVICGEIVATVSVGRGVEQGCPLSGSIFALAVDPLLRRSAQGPGPLDHRVFAYADDLALVLRLLKEGLARLLPIFRCWASVGSPG